MKLLYLADIRFPMERANGIQIDDADVAYRLGVYLFRHELFERAIEKLRRSIDLYEDIYAEKAQPWITYINEVELKRREPAPQEIVAPGVPPSGRGSRGRRVSPTAPLVLPDGYELAPDDPRGPGL